MASTKVWIEYDLKIMFAIGFPGRRVPGMIWASMLMEICEHVKIRLRDH